MTATVDFDAPYVLPPDLTIVQRDSSTIQIGTEQPRTVLLVNAPARAGAVFASLSGSTSIGEVLRRWESDRREWSPVLSELLARDMLVSATSASPGPPDVAGERLSLIHRYGARTADRLLAARADALVVIDSHGPIADTIAELLAASGIGHIHQRGNGSAGQRAAWQASHRVRVHRPAPQMPPSLVVLAGSEPPPLARAAELVTGLIPHLAVRANQARVRVGPLVLPGRSACLNCLDRHRRDADPAWPEVVRAIRGRTVQPSPAAAHLAASVAAGQVLGFLDGLRRPDTVGAVLEQPAAALRITRRGWSTHPECGCSLLSGRW